MSKSKIGKCHKAGDRGIYQPWFRKRRARNRVRDKMAKESRRIKQEAMMDRISKVTIILVTPENGREQRRVFDAPKGQLFARSGVKRVLDEVLAWAKKQYHLTKFVVFQEDVADFRFIPENMVDKDLFVKRLHLSSLLN